MKKKYERPFIAMESFQLDAAIAGACKGDNLNPLGYSVYTCTFDNGGDLLFAEGSRCTHDIFDENSTECYQAPTIVTQLGVFLAS